MEGEPELEEFEDFYLRAFWLLVTERRGGHVIPHSEIRQYGEREGLDSAMIETFIQVIWALERAQADWANGERERVRQMNAAEK